MSEPIDQGPDPRTDPRPEPRWGQYSDAPPPLVAPAADLAPTGPHRPAERSAQSQHPAPRRTGDIVLTVFLLGIGLIDVVLRFGQFESFAVIFHEAYAQMGYGEFTSDAAANAMGTVQNVARVIILLVAIGLSVRLIAQGKRAFWVPLAAGVVAAIVLTLGFFVVVIGDPALAQYAQTL